MPFIDFAWRDYFTNFHEGIGTTYERFMLHRLFERLVQRYDIHTVLEVPAFGMTGISDINSMWWSQHGRSVTVVDHDGIRIELAKKVWRESHLGVTFMCCTEDYTPLSFEGAPFDLSWNFAALRYVRDLEAFLREMTRVTRRAIFLCVPNRRGIGHVARRLLDKQERDGAATRNTDPSRIQSLMTAIGWRLAESGRFDVPPWPDIAMKKEDLLRKLGLTGLADRVRIGTDVGCILDYFRGADRGLEQRVSRYAVLEASPCIVKAFWAHHQYLLFTPQ
jgi:SAM-dependent methyltransferase